MTPTLNRDSLIPPVGVIATQTELPLSAIATLSQRWRNGRASYRPAQEPINPRDFTVEPLGKTAAKRFVETHHYSRSFVYERASFGLWHKRGLAPSELVGVASFSTPSNPASIERWAGLPEHQGIELGRFCLLNHIGGNAETFFLAASFRQLKARLPEIRIVLSYSDPLPRLNLLSNTLAFRGHRGVIYSAANALFAGRASPKTLYLNSSGTAIPNRILTKLRNNEAGAAGAEESLERISGLRRRAGESAAAFIHRVLKGDAIRAVRHRGNYLFLFPLASNRREKQAILNLPKVREHRVRALPYPKVIDHPA